MSETVKLYGINRLRDTLVVSESTRKSMQGNRSRDTLPEIRLRQALWKAGLRGYRKNVRKLPGTPDIVFGRAGLAVFVHGCFWHGHDCGKTKLPSQNRAFWSTKITLNRERHLRNVERLETMGYAVMTVWECELKGREVETVERVRAALGALA